MNSTKIILLALIVLTAIGITAFTGILKKNDTKVITGKKMSINNDQTNFSYAANNTAGSEQQQGAIDAELSTVTKPLPIYGFNGNNIHGPAWSNTQLLTNIESLQMKMVRYPGGSVSDWWDWRKGWLINGQERATNNDDDDDGKANKGAATKLAAKYASKSKTLVQIPLGLDALKFLTNRTGSEVLFTLNMISSNLKDQVEMLQTAKSMGITVKWVELGNESNLPKSDGYEKFKGPVDYANTCKYWIDSIKKVFPGVLIGVVGGDQDFATQVRNWNKTVLSIDNNADALILHSYPSLSTPGIDFQDLYSGIVENYKDQGFSNLPAGMEIWVTEYNILWTGLRPRNPQKVLQYATSWSQALGTILQTSTLTQALKSTTMLLNHNLSGIERFAAIGTENNNIKLLPNGMGMQAWLKASNNMSNMQKINFKDGRNQTLEDYNILGWKFYNGSHANFLITNFTGTEQKVNLSSLLSTLNNNYTSFYADKDKDVNSMDDVQKKTGQLEKVNGKPVLPPYSITLITQ